MLKLEEGGVNVAKSKTPAKRARRAARNQARNTVSKSAMKGAVKKFETAVADNNIELARENWEKVVSIIDKNAGKKIIHRHTAARMKSRLASKLKALSASDANA